jgi:c(7)-type cytochrome triheme protein
MNNGTVNYDTTARYKGRVCMKSITAGMVAVITIFCAGSVQAIQPGKTVTWETPMGKVIFDGKNHADAKVACLDCHSKIFKMKKGSTTFTMADINAGKFCGKCHNGKRAFAANDKDNCEICHKKK